MVGTDYAALITDAQEIVRQVLAQHPAVLHDPEPTVLVDSPGPLAVHLPIRCVAFGTVPLSAGQWCICVAMASGVL